MRVKYDLKDNHFKYYNEANGAIMSSKRLIRRKKGRPRTYLTMVSLYGFLAISLCSMLMIVSRIYEINSLLDISKILLWYIVFVYLFSVCNLIFSSRSSARTNNMEGTLKILKRGIVDEGSDGSKVEIAYDKVDVVVVTKNAIVFILKSPFMIYINNKDKDKVIKALNKNSDVLIVDHKE